ncbi:1-acyl-sn-glycerol-3-phosphate acyltransferases [Formosa sp. Hel1_31_208]|uniref:lysophospholipid acyltransferase family protein n=1 Tax=Formosa sp. Hel1_31_208 TaxID=1798225 RepID=UPI00087A7CF8|nr:lysophospholipid acyltransferase family protein [Formosa sp. Hel1_31_208]SDS58816.1 1-acyl-sn-glycerol-3-phosphate acyltransferases [Formosa sp. Hel1_31_208]
MKQLWLYSIRSYLRLGLFFYFKKVEVINLKAIPKDEPVIFLANHQNALLDAILIAVKNGRFSYFLTRASVFSVPLISKMLQSLQMLPVYRVRDGFGNLSKNTSVFTKSSQLLHEKKAIVIFPEGNHNLKRTVRPLSKGFTRIIFQTLEDYPETKINVVPVGLNFKHATKYSDSALINFGVPFQVGSELLNDKNKSVLQLKEDVFLQLCQLTTHIESENYDIIITYLEKLNVDFTQPKHVNQCISNGFETCKKGLPEHDHRLKRLSKVLLIINLFIPYIIWKKMIQPKISEVEFISTFRFVIAITLVPVFIIVVMSVLGVVFELKYAFIYLFSVIVLNIFSVKL